MIWLIVIGFAAGILSGMGIGGGAILIPALTIFWGVSQQNAQHINLMYFIPTALFAVREHKKSGNIQTKGLPALIILGLVGALPGALLAINLNADILRKCFAGFLLCIALYEIWKGYRAIKSKKSKQL